METCPTWLDGETVFSLIQRLAVLQCKTNKMHSLDHLFGSCSLLYFSDFPSFLPKLSELSGVDIEYIIREHTILPACRVFLAPSKYKSVMSGLLKSESKKVFTCQSLTATKNYEKKVLYFCPQCARDDESEVGVAYWHIRHQLPGAHVCLRHKCILEKQLATKYAFENWPNWSRCQHVLASDKAVKLTQFINYLYDTPFSFQHSLKALYIIALRYGGMVTRKGLVRMTLLREQLIQYWEPLFNIDEISDVFSAKQSEVFPEAIFYRSDSTFTPIKHLLIMVYLFKSVHQIRSFDRNYDDFVLASSANLAFTQSLGGSEMIIELIEKKYTLHEIAETTTMSINYIRKIAKKSGLNIKAKKHFMPQAERKAIIFKLLAGYSTKNIAMEFERHEGTIEKILKLHPDIVELRVKRRHYKKRKIEREKLLHYLAHNEAKTRRKIQLAITSTYHWLYNYDTEWLYGHVPASIRY